MSESDIEVARGAIDTEQHVQLQPETAPEQHRYTPPTAEEKLERLCRYLDSLVAPLRDTPTVPPTEEEAKINRVCDAIATCGCDATYKNALASSFGALLGIEIDWRKSPRNGTVQQHMIVVPIANNNGHDYPLNEPFLVLECGKTSCEGIKMDRNYGNTCRYADGAIRYATYDEIKKWVLAQENIEEVMKMLRVVIA